MSEVNAPQFGYDTRPDLARLTVQAMLGNLRARGRIKMSMPTGKRSGYFFDLKDQHIVEAFLNDPEEVRMAAWAEKRSAGIGAGLAKKKAADALVIFDMVIEDQRVVFRKWERESLEAFVNNLLAENSALVSRTESVELALKDALDEEEALIERLGEATKGIQRVKAQITQVRNERNFAAQRADEMHKQFVAIGEKPRFRIKAVSQKSLPTQRAA